MTTKILRFATASEDPLYNRQTPEGARDYELPGEKKKKKRKLAIPSNWAYTNTNPEMMNTQRSLERFLQNVSAQADW